jgi:dihydrofolate synthase/folylpolyglutamate synthase
LGGRLDSTNVIQPLVSVITNISYDHMNLLGNTLPLIAAEKAGIIKAKTPVVITEKQLETAAVFETYAKKQKAPLYYASDTFTVSKSQPYQSNAVFTIKTEGKTKFAKVEMDLIGHYQKKNILGVLQTLKILNDLGICASEKDIRQGLKNVKGLTGIRGRWELLSNSPPTIADTGHNEAGIREVLAQIKKTPHKRLFFVLGMVNDKDIGKILGLLPKNALYYFCKASVPRALDAQLLADQANELGLRGMAWPTVKKALKAAQTKAKNGDLVFVGGSTFTVADALK